MFGVSLLSSCYGRLSIISCIIISCIIISYFSINFFGCYFINSGFSGFGYFVGSINIGFSNSRL